MKKFFLGNGVSVLPDLGKLILRLGFGGLMALNHGWSKFTQWDTMKTEFADIWGMGISTSAALCIFGELFCGTLIAIGLFTRLACIPAALTMAAAVLITHWNDPFTDKEHALLFLMGYVAIFLTGPGKYSLDSLIRK